MADSSIQRTAAVLRRSRGAITAPQTDFGFHSSFGLRQKFVTIIIIHQYSTWYRDWQPRMTTKAWEHCILSFVGLFIPRERSRRALQDGAIDEPLLCRTNKLYREDLKRRIPKCRMHKGTTERFLFVENYAV